MKQIKLAHEFVEYIPDDLVEGVLYISMSFATASHKCGCGCGQEVVTPLTPTDWKLIFNGETVSLDPSIGNWSFPCQSHYWIRNNRISWAENWSQEKINAGRAYDSQQKEKKFAATTAQGPGKIETKVLKQRQGFLPWIKNLFGEK